MNVKHLWCLSITLAIAVSLGLPAAVAQGTKASGEAPKTAIVSVGEKRKVEGTITGREGDRLTVRPTAMETDVVVKLGSFTEIVEKKANPLRRARKYQASHLVPGLTVVVDGRGDSDGALVADKIRFTNNDFKTARNVDVRMSPVEQNARRMSGQIEEMGAVSNAARGGAKAAQETADKAHDRITKLDDYEAVHSVTVLFKAGSAVLSAEARKSLDEIAQQAKSRKGFVIEVAGFASSEGSLAFNRRLSRHRAEAVSEYLAEQHDIPLRRIMVPTGYGVSHPVADNSTRAGRQENRRVEVRVLVSRGMIAPPSGSPPSSDSGQKGSSN